MNSASALKITQPEIGGMDCGGCAKTIAANLQQLPGIELPKQRLTLVAQGFYAVSLIVAIVPILLLNDLVLVTHTSSSRVKRDES